MSVALGIVYWRPQTQAEYEAEPDCAECGQWWDNRTELMTDLQIVRLDDGRPICYGCADRLAPTLVALRDLARAAGWYGDAALDTHPTMYRTAAGADLYGPEAMLAAAIEYAATIMPPQHRLRAALHPGT